jgi:hypothetical protein
VVNPHALRWSLFFYSPYGKRPEYDRDYPPQYYPPPGYYYPYPNVNPHEAAYQAHEADKLARWIWMLVAIVVIIAICGVIAVYVVMIMISSSEVIVPIGALVFNARAGLCPPNF